MNHKIIIAPLVMHRALLKNLRDNDVFLNPKFFSREQLIKEYYGYFLNGSIIELMFLEKINYDTAKTFLNFLPFVHESFGNLKLEALLKMKQNLLKKNLYRKNTYLETEFKNKDIEIYGYEQNDYYLTLILEKIAFENKKTFLRNEGLLNDQTVLKVFNNVEAEVHYVMNEIVSLIKSGVSAQNIKLFGVDETYLYQVEKYAKMYGINLNGLPPKSLFMTSIGKEFLSSYKKNQEIEPSVLETFKEKDLNKDEQSVKTLIVNYEDKRLNFNEQYDVYKNVLKENHAFQNRYKTAIEIISGDNGVKGQEVFVIGFRQGVYPLSKQDNDYLNEEEKQNIGYISIDKKNSDRLFSLLNFLKSDNNFHFSFALADLTSDFLPSFIATDNRFKKETPGLGLLDHSLLASKIELVKMLDLKSKYNVIEQMLETYKSALSVPYKTYDHSFKGVLAIDENTKLVHSYTNLNTFISCQFRYYLENVLKISDNSDNFNLKIGNLGHFIFERCLKNKKDFDFEKTYLQGYENIQKRYPWTAQDDVLLISIKNFFAVACEHILKHDREMKSAVYDLEKTLTFQLNNNSIFKGKIDKIITVGNYVYLVDYKTGREQFDSRLVSTYRSLQLPAYALLLQNSSDYQDKEIGGLYINNVIDFSMRDPSQHLVHPYLKLNGVTLLDINNSAIEGIAPGLQNSTDPFVKFDLQRLKPENMERKGFITKNKLEEYIELTKRKYLENDAEIRKNNFVINPKKYSNKKDDDACKYCPFENICYKTQKDLVSVETLNDENDEAIEDEME
ncbi:MAG: PD-(D/E)XK nuclease family protein [Bacilli bacterium]